MLPRRPWIGASCLRQLPSLSRFSFFSSPCCFPCWRAIIARTRTGGKGRPRPCSRANRQSKVERHSSTTPLRQSPATRKVREPFSALPGGRSVARRGEWRSRLPGPRERRSAGGVGPMAQGHLSRNRQSAPASIAVRPRDCALWQVRGSIKAFYSKRRAVAATPSMDWRPMSKPTAITVAALLLLLAVLASQYSANLHRQAWSIERQKWSGAFDNDPASPIAGNPQGDAVLVIFNDYHNCPHCRLADLNYQKAIKDDPNCRSWDRIPNSQP